MKVVSEADIESINSDMIAELFTNEPAYKTIITDILRFAMTNRTTEELIQRIINQSTHITLLQPASTILSWVIKSGGIDAAAIDSGEHYWVTTSSGRIAMERENSVCKTKQLFSDDTESKDIYEMILRYCFEPRTRGEIEDMLEIKASLNESELQPGYFIGVLEDAGALEWRGKWETADNIKVLPEMMGC